ncbi:MAG: TatD family hydrolase [Spirochaetes bacterium]|nr:TatD family hydrolase [Spirochaetota bacterium]
MFADTHCHLRCIEQNNTDIDGIIENAMEKKVSFVIDISTGLDDFLTRCDLVKRLSCMFPVDFYLSAGIPPYFAQKRTSRDMDVLREQCCADPRVVAVGECGLDYHHGYGTKDEQKSLFADQIGVADDIGLPVVVHSRDADDDLVGLLERRMPRCGAIIHCFSSGPEVACRLLDLGCTLSFAGNITYKRAEGVRETARMVQSDRYVIETDSPYLPPEGRRGTTNEPANVAIVASFIADIRGVCVEAVAQETMENAKRAFRLKSPRKSS